MAGLKHKSLREIERWSGKRQRDRECVKEKGCEREGTSNLRVILR